MQPSRPTIVNAILLLLLLPVWGCNTVYYGDIDPFYRELSIYADYVSRPDTPLTIDASRTSAAVIMQDDPVVGSCGTDQVCIELRNVRLSDRLGVYDVLDVITEEQRDGRWEVDAENRLAFSRVERLDVVLVLDVSSSLGDDAALMKTYARTFLDSIQRNSLGARVAVVGFSQNVETFPMSNDFGAAAAFITNLSGTDATKLYEAVSAGLDLLSDSRADGRAIVIFTDGRNDAWSDVRFQSPDPLIERIDKDDTTESMVSSYTIGLKDKGGVDEDVLKRLARNGGKAEFVQNGAELEDVFSKVANSVSAAYNFVYSRNTSTVASPIHLRFRIQTRVF